MDDGLNCFKIILEANTIKMNCHLSGGVFVFINTSSWFSEWSKLFTFLTASLHEIFPTFLNKQSVLSGTSNNTPWEVIFSEYHKWPVSDGVGYVRISVIIKNICNCDISKLLIYLYLLLYYGKISQLFKWLHLVLFGTV